jgi:hypothetical protein
MEPVHIIAIAAAIGAILSAIGSVANASGSLTEMIFGREKKEETIEDRVLRLTKALTEATTLISNIEGEIKARSALAIQLQQDIDQYNQLVELKKPEAEAVAQLLRGELQKESRSSFWKGFALNFLFFVLGAAASWIINILTMR